MHCLPVDLRLSTAISLLSNHCFTDSYSRGNATPSRLKVREQPQTGAPYVIKRAAPRHLNSARPWTSIVVLSPNFPPSCQPSNASPPGLEWTGSGRLVVHICKGRSLSRRQLQTVPLHAQRHALSTAVVPSTSEAQGCASAGPCQRSSKGM